MSDLIKQCDECKLNECINCEHSWADIQELKKQLAEKDKEIEELRQTIIDLYNTNINLEMYSKTIREQVCEEIRNSVEVAKLRYMWEGKKLNIDKILDQIEKGE